MGGLIYSVEKFLLGWTRIVRRLVSLFAFKINCLVSVLCGSLLKGITEETVKLVFFACVCVYLYQKLKNKTRFLSHLFSNTIDFSQAP